MANNTTIIPQTKQNGTSLPLMESFYTLQGEGAFTGQAAYFIRLGGCDVGCVWCDVKESWEASKHPVVKVDDIVALASENPARMAVITGGEPCMHQLGPLTELLHQKGFRTHIETSGTHPLSGKFDWVCFSPKKFKAPLAEFFEKADELKVVVYHKSDLEWAQNLAAKVRPDCLLFLQPEWSKKNTMMPVIVDFVKSNPAWRVGIQTHKYLDIP